MKVVETERLILRVFSLNDAPFILELVNDPSWLQYIGDREIHTLAEARLYLQTGPMNSYQRFGFELYLTQLKGEEVPIGLCGLIKRAVLPDVDMGFAFLSQFTGKGYAFEAATAVLTYSKTELKLARVTAVTAPENVPSIKLLRKLGFRYEMMVHLSPDEPETQLYSLDLV